MFLFFVPPLTSFPSKPCYLCFSRILLFSSSFFILVLLSSFFFSNFFLLLLCHFLFFLSFHPVSLLSVIFILYSLCLRYYCSKIKQALFCMMWKRNMITHLIVIWMFLEKFPKVSLWGGMGGRFLVANVSTNTQWIVLILLNFRFIHLRQAW